MLLVALGALRAVEGVGPMCVETNKTRAGGTSFRTPFAARMEGYQTVQPAFFRPLSITLVVGYAAGPPAWLHSFGGSSYVGAGPAVFAGQGGVGVGVFFSNESCG